MNIRVAVKNDSKAVNAILRATFHLACPEKSSRELQEIYLDKNLSTEKISEFLSSSHHDTWVAEDAGNVIGFCMVDFIGDVPELSKCYVLTEFHGQGIAQKLIESALSCVIERKFDSVELNVYSQNKKAIGFYKKNGFEFVRVDIFNMESESHRDNVFRLKFPNLK